MTRSATESRIRDINLDEIDRSRNHRIPRPGDAERLEALKQSIEACGQLLQPVRVYERGPDQKDKKHPQPYILGFGARRCAAMELLGKKTVLAVVFGPASDAEIAQARAVENVNRQDITPLEEVQAVSDVLEAIKADEKFTGDVHEEAAARLGCDVSWVKDRDYLHRLTKPVQRFALRSALPAGHLRELAKIGDPQDQMRLACGAVGAPPEAFPWEPKEAKPAEWQRQIQDKYFAALTDGMVERWALSQLKGEVARVQLSLRMIPWDFDLPVQFGSTKLRKCAGCPHNSETDRTLFGIDEDTANPQGYCLYASCYNAKHQATEAAKEQVFKKISGRNDQTPEAIRKIAPEWLKETTVVAYVKRQLEKSKIAETEKPKPRAPQVEKPLSDHEVAIRKFAETFNAWEEEAFTRVLEGINSDPLYRVNWCVLLGVPAFWEHPRMELPSLHIHGGDPSMRQPVLPPLPEAIEQAIRLAFKGTRNGWMEVLKDHEQIDPDQRPGLGIPHPKVLELLAEAMKVELPAAPTWTRVQAEPERSEAVAEQTEAVSV